MLISMLFCCRFVCVVMLFGCIVVMCMLVSFCECLFWFSLLKFMLVSCGLSCVFFIVVSFFVVSVVCIWCVLFLCSRFSVILLFSGSRFLLLCNLLLLCSGLLLSVVSMLFGLMFVVVVGEFLFICVIMVFLVLFMFSSLVMCGVMFCVCMFRLLCCILLCVMSCFIILLDRLVGIVKLMFVLVLEGEKIIELMFISLLCRFISVLLELFGLIEVLVWMKFWQLVLLSFEWFSVEMMFEVIVWFSLNGLFIVIMKLFICSLEELVIGSVCSLLVLICIIVMLVFGLVLISVFLKLCLFCSVIVMLLVLFIMWLLVRMQFLVVFIIMFEFRFCLVCLCGVLGRLKNW